jgi:hypothetical protein
VVLATSEKELQISVSKLSKISQSYNFKMSGKNTKVTGFKGNNPIRTQILLDEHSLEHVLFQLPWL